MVRCVLVDDVAQQTVFGALGLVKSCRPSTRPRRQCSEFYSLAVAVSRHFVVRHVWLLSSM